ncbi:hypothetical protein [Kitasatospora sp. NPDC001527]|uniref:hypothetical protein n=1 Tax=Kitasatospora sp. NPDC001527 TaxID=3154519 RepID=UPI00332689CF
MMTCQACGRRAGRNPSGRCPWSCYDQDRATDDEQRAMLTAAPEAFACVAGMAYGRRLDGDPP